MSNMGTWQGTRYQPGQLQFGPNSVRVKCTEHDVSGSDPGWEEIHESRFTEDEMTKVVYPFIVLIAEKYEAIRDEQEAALGLNPSEAIARAAVHAILQEAKDAEATKAQLEAEAQAAAQTKAQLEADAAAKQAEIASKTQQAATLDTQLADKQAAEAAIDAAIAAKQAQLDALNAAAVEALVSPSP